MDSRVLTPEDKKLHRLRITRNLQDSRPFTLDDFKASKKKPVFKTWRTLGKNIVFGNLFGQTPVSFGTGMIAAEWSAQQVDEFIKLRGLEENLDIFKEKYAGKFKAHEIKCITCAEQILEDFFEVFPGLLPWHRLCFQEASRNGYVHSAFGARRLLPELSYIGQDSNGRVVKNLKNISINTKVQNHEVVWMHRAMRKIDDKLEEEKMGSSLFGNTHDAAMMYIKKKESDELVPFIDQAFCLDLPENNGIPYTGATNLADIKKGETWGFGALELEHGIDVEDYHYEADEEDDFE